jgi:hypothetical protein
LVVVEAQILMPAVQVAVQAAAQVKALQTTHLVERVHLGKVLLVGMGATMVRLKTKDAPAVAAVQVVVVQVAAVSQTAV